MSAARLPGARPGPVTAATQERDYTQTKNALAVAGRIGCVDGLRAGRSAGGCHRSADDPAPVPQLERGHAPQGLLKVAGVTLVCLHELRDKGVVDAGHHAL